MLCLDEYREMMTTLDRADADLLSGTVHIQEYRRLTAEHLEKIRDAVEDCLFRDHHKLGFASENPAVPAARRVRAPRNKLTPEDAAKVRDSSGPARIVAERFGISVSRVSEIRNGIVR
jgi:hypothetical protein